MSDRSGPSREDHTQPLIARVRRGFALPLVILLTLIVSLAAATLMQRNGAGYLAARRQADGYAKAHAGLGIREMVSRWLTQVRGRLSDSLEEDGYAFSLEMPHGERVDVYLEDAQGPALARGDALTGRRREIVEMMNAYLDMIEFPPTAGASRTNPSGANRPAAAATGGSGAASAGGGGFGVDSPPLRRMYGPSEISVRTAPREVLEALASAIVDPKKVTAVADAIIRKRDDQTGTRDMSIDEITRTLREVGLDDEALHEFGAMMVYVPKLYMVTAELRDTSDRLVDKAQGLLEVNEGSNDPFNMNGPFLTWENVDLESQRN